MPVHTFKISLSLKCQPSFSQSPIMVQVPAHILLITNPAQGHLNPTLQFAKRLIQLGVKVTFATSIFVHRCITKSTNRIPEGINFSVFSDGYDDGYKHGVDDFKRFVDDMKRTGSQALRETIISCSNEGRPITCLVYSLFLPWASEVAHALHVPSALLWIQPATVFDIYYHYFNGYGEVIGNMHNQDPSFSIELPGVPPVKACDIPSFLFPNSPGAEDFMLSVIREQLDMLAVDEVPKVLVNTFDALESTALKAINTLNLIAVGPLIPSAFLDEKDPTDTSFGGDLFEKSKDYVEWMNSKEKESIVYISFGSLLDLPKKQMEQIARGLLDSQKPFLWVVRDKHRSLSGIGEEGQQEDEKLSCLKELEQLGLIVSWCSQLEVLSHPSLGCFVTHCGWNSTLESVVSGVPVVAFPQWSEQGTNAKLIEDVWSTGERVKVNEEGIVERGEIKRCIEMVMGKGESGEAFRRNARKWKELGREAMIEGGSSDKNLKAFIAEVSQNNFLV